MINPNDFESILVLTGAGISAESGLKTFRDSNGLWEGHRVEDVATPEAFARSPATVHAFYNMRRRQLITSTQPNAAHRALGEFTKTFHGQFCLVTQNVDNLHERGGSESVIHMHGELLKARCNHSDQVFDIDHDLTEASICRCCGKKATLRPHIVWFGEIPLFMEEIESALTQCDLFVSIGTSGQVYPAAGFKQRAQMTGATTVELNLEPTGTYSQFDHAYYGPATQLVSAFFRPE